MRVLVTGGTGFIGSHLVEQLLQKKYDVFCLVRDRNNLKWLSLLGGQVKYIYADLSSRSSLESALSDSDAWDYIYHLAGVVKANRKELYYEANFLGTKYLIETAAALDNKNLKKFLHVSTLAAVGPSGNGRAVTEETKCRPVTDYGVSKLMGERIVLEYLDRLPITIVRPPVVYGPRDRDLLIYFKIINYGLKPIIGTRKYINIIYVHDLVNGIIQAAESKEATGRTYFIANPESYSIEYISNLVQQSLNCKVITLRIPDGVVKLLAAGAEYFSRLKGRATIFNRQKAREIAQHFWVCDTGRVQQELGFKTRVSLKNGLKQTAEWYLSNKWLS
ncbi:MAG: NAD(P)-dependent oxidoreductase [Planctomycetota bacterium]